MYQDVAAPLVDSIVEGYNGTVFAYGQTGSGKTHTMYGGVGFAGVVPQAVEHLFSAVCRGDFEQSLIRVSFCEIYNEAVRDLLGTDRQVNLDIREEPGSAPYVQGLTWLTVKHREEITAALEVN